MSSALADAAVLPVDLLRELETARCAADEAEVRVLRVAVEWAHAHPVLESDDGWRPWRPWRSSARTAVPLAELDSTVEGLDVTDPDAEE